MRLWHWKLIPYLSNQRLLGLHREVCAMRGRGWGKKHSTVDYVYRSSYLSLYKYHKKVYSELAKRGYRINQHWQNPYYRGRWLQFSNRTLPLPNSEMKSHKHYPEQDDKYLFSDAFDLLSRQDHHLPHKSLSADTRYDVFTRITVLRDYSF